MLKKKKPCLENNEVFLIILRTLFTYNFKIFTPGMQESIQIICVKSTFNSFLTALQINIFKLSTKFELSCCCKPFTSFFFSRKH